jgi:hypothetical protein
MPEVIVALLANVYIDVVALSEGIVVLLISIPLVLVCEYGAFRLSCPGQTKLKAILLCLYANLVSTAIGYPILGLLSGLSGIDLADALGGVLLWFFCLVFTSLVEWGAIYPLRKLLIVKKPWTAVLAANVTSYVALAVLLLIVRSIR